MVKPGTGFPTHPHKEMEIITIVLDGEMTHEDSMGNKAVIKCGDVQRMSAGTGLTHSEFNRAERPVHFYQIWIFPDQANLKPSYDQRSFKPEQWKNCLLPVASGQNIPDTVTFFTDATIYRSSLDAGKKLSFEKTAVRRIFIYLTSGQLDVNGTPLDAKDQARIDEDGSLTIKAHKAAEFILIDVPSCKGWGYNENTLHGASK